MPKMGIGLWVVRERGAHGLEVSVRRRIIAVQKA